MSMNNRILIVDDEIDLCQILKFNLESAGYEADIANSGEEALSKDLSKYHLFVFDVMMDGISGFDLLKILRLDKNIKTPVVFITALTEEDKVLEGFSLGADDYIRKPFSPKEVVARINVVIERSYRTLDDDKNNSGLIIDNMKKRIILNSTPIDFTRTEYEIFCLLYEEPGKVYSRDEILKIVWTDQQYVLDRTVDVNITRIRKKLGDLGGCIVTRSGYGYYFDVKKIDPQNMQLEAV